MISILCILLIFIGFLLVKNYINKHTWLFVAAMLGLELAIFAAIIYISKVESYPYPRNNLLQFDYRLFLLFNGMKIQYYSLIRMMNIGIALYIAIMPFFIKSFTHGQGYNLHLKHVLKTIAVFVLPMFYIWFYDPITSYYIYNLIQELESPQKDTVLYIIKCTDAANYVWIILYQLTPVYSFIRFFRKIVIVTNKKRVFSVVFCQSVLNCLFSILFVFGPFREVYFLGGETALLGFRRYTGIPEYYFTLLPVIVLVVFLIMLFMLIKYKGIDSVDFFQQRVLRRNVKGLNTDLKSIFHSFKNTLFAMEVMGKQAQIQFGDPEQTKTLEEMVQFAQSSAASIAKMLDSLKEVKLAVKHCKVIDIIEEAVERVKIDQHITVEKLYECDSAKILADPYYITEALTNIIQNSADSIQTAKRQKGVITIEVIAEHEWIAIKITDNGTGIRKHDIHKIFKEFYTTKSRRNNWGVGLSGAYKIISKHLGYITVESVYGEYARFQIVLPKALAREGIE